MTYNKNGKTYHCPVEAALDVIGGKWKPLILWALGENIMRFGELQKGLPGVNAKMLTHCCQVNFENMPISPISLTKLKKCSKLYARV